LITTMKKNIYAGPMLDIIRLSEFPFVSGADVAKVLEENGKLWEAVLVDFSVDIQEVAEAENGDGVILKSFSLTTKKENTTALYSVLAALDPSVIAIESTDEFCNQVTVDWHICDCCAR
jgi:hypothetical protein